MSIEEMTTSASILLAVLIIAMSVAASLLIGTIPPMFSPEGGDPVRAAVFAWAFIVFAVGAKIVRSASTE